MKILLVEDDMNLAVGLKYSLKEEGFEIRHAESLGEAKDIFLNNKTDLILLDIMLPDGDGYDFCKWVRERDSRIPVIFLTAMEQEESVVKGFGLGANDYVTKPFRVAELVARIKAHYNRSENDYSDDVATISLKRFKLDHSRLCVWKEGERIDLTPTEYKIVRKLVENLGNVVSRDELTKSLWENAGEFLDVNTLSVHIKRIREKLGENDKDGCIRTIRGEGYCFVNE
ncbi:MAG: response regulator transcription factor [Lachnospiraceae bacterium]|nr:response regulator transcription factor [Lachnospiraceae bacterium]